MHRMKVIGTIIIGLALALSLGGCAPASTPSAPSATMTPTTDGASAPSPGLIAYLDLDRRLWVMDADGQNRRPLVQEEEVSALAWSPDGQTLACIEQEAGSEARQAVLCDLSTRQRRVIGPADERLSRLVWSPDGRYLVLDSGTGLVRALRIVEVAGGQVVREVEAIGYAWSPDGSYLAIGLRQPLEQPISIEPLDSVSLAVLRMDGEAPQTLLEGTAQALYFPRVWLPDGRLVYERLDWDEARQEGHRSLWALPFQGEGFGEAQPVAKLPPRYDREAVLERLPAEFRQENVGLFSWSPDGRWVVFDAGQWPDLAIYRFDWVEGGHPRRLTEGTSPRWQPRSATP